MADHKRPTRLVYNYEKDASKSDKSHPQRVIYDYERSAARPVKQETKATNRVPQQQTPTLQTPPLAQSPGGKKAQQRNENTGDAELVFPARPAPPAREQRERQSGVGQSRQRQQEAFPVSGRTAHSQTMAAQSRTAVQAKTSQTSMRDKRTVEPQANRGATSRPRPVPQKKKKKGILAALFARKKASAVKQHKRQVVLSDARAQRRRRSFYTALGVVIAVVVGIVLSLTVLFKIETIEVEGDAGYEQAEIIAAFGHKTGDNLFTFSKQKTIEAMQQKLPYLETVEIHRTLPNKVRIVVTRAQDAYSVSSVLGWAVLSESLRVLRIDPAEPPDIARIIGAEALEPSLGMVLQMEDADKLAALKKVLNEVETQELLPVTELDLTDILNINFVYNGRIRIVLGTINELTDKIDWAKYLVTPSGEQSLSETERGTLDVSGRNEEGRIEAIWRAGTI